MLPKGAVTTLRPATSPAPCISFQTLKEGAINHTHRTHSEEVMFLQPFSLYVWVKPFHGWGGIVFPY